jgi:formate hydrogenlyase subunit 6/NADH:ubiquinone oxidoreductase subunit I
MRKPGKMTPFVIGMLREQAATVLYPFAAPILPEKSRGKIKFQQENCIGCKLCMKDCPANAIFIEKIADKQFKAYIYLDRCIYCAQCVDSCRKEALEITPEFELAGFQRNSMKVDI